MNISIRSRWMAVVAVALVVVASPVAAGSSPDNGHLASNNDVAGRTGGAATPRLELVAQRFAVEPGGTIELRYILDGLSGDPFELLPAPVPTLQDPTNEPVDALLPPEPVAVTVEVVNYGPLDDPDDTTDIASLVGSNIDPVVVGALGRPIDGVMLDARPMMTRNSDGSVNIDIDIPTDTNNSIETRLRLQRPGLYPLQLRVLLGSSQSDTMSMIASAGTIVQRLPDPATDDAVLAPPIDLSVISVTPPAHPDADDATIDLVREQLDQAIDLAAALTSPVTLEVPPGLVADTAAAPGGAERLAASLVDDEFVALPVVPLDVSSAAAAGRGDTYTRFVRTGEDQLIDAVPSIPSRRAVWITSDAISADGAQHLRDLGTRFVVIPPELFRSPIDGTPPPTDLFIEAALPDGGTMPFLIIDPLATQLTTQAADRILRASSPTEWGVATLAEMLVTQSRDDALALASAGSANTTTSTAPPTPPRRSRVLTTPDLSSPDSRLLVALEQLAQTTPAVRFTPASALSGVTDAIDNANGADPISIKLPEVAGVSLDYRIELLERTALDLVGPSSMLPGDDPRLVEWPSRLERLISTAYSNDQVTTSTTALRTDADVLRQAVRAPDPFTFTLTGRSGSIELRIANNSDVPLDVVLALESTKVTFPEGDQPVTLRPLGETAVMVPVDAETNGTSAITLTLSTPSGEILGEPVTLTARVTAFTGLGQVLTGGLVAVLLTWWFTHWRSRRRTDLTIDGRERHPCNPT